MWKSLKQFWFDIEDVLLNVVFKILFTVQIAVILYLIIVIIKLHQK